MCVHPDGDIRFRLQLSIKGRHIYIRFALRCLNLDVCLHGWLTTGYCPLLSSPCYSHPQRDLNLLWHLSVSACRILWQAGRLLSLAVRMLAILKLNFKPHQSIGCPLHAPIRLVYDNYFWPSTWPPPVSPSAPVCHPSLPAIVIRVQFYYPLKPFAGVFATSPTHLAEF